MPGKPCSASSEYARRIARKCPGSGTILHCSKAWNPRCKLDQERPHPPPAPSPASQGKEMQRAAIWNPSPCNLESLLLLQSGILAPLAIWNPCSPGNLESLLPSQSGILAPAVWNPCSPGNLESLLPLQSGILAHLAIWNPCSACNLESFLRLRGKVAAAGWGSRRGAAIRFSSAAWPGVMSLRVTHEVRRRLR